ncbi:MAG TPA: aldehyde dehydrogenase family protein [Thermoanaerobaculia bacterium]|nr:aldehyde dehydrogenase family protein [Thermoanaerobaculia bacterium]
MSSPAFSLETASPFPAPPGSWDAAAALTDWVGREAALARRAQVDWAAEPLARRLAVLRALRRRIAADPSALVPAAAGLRPDGEVLTSEVLPLAEACRFLEREAPRILAPRFLGSAGRPAWLGGVETEVRRLPLGLVLILAPTNYPLFLPGVQALQALAAGNAVIWKPGRGGLNAARAFAALAVGAGLDPRLLRVLPEDPEAGRAALAAGPDKVFLTGSAATGRQVLADLAPRLIPATMELSGCDALFVLPEATAADLDRVARAVAFSLRLNGGATCIAPRRIFVPRGLAAGLERRLEEEAGRLPAVPLREETTERLGPLVDGALQGGARRSTGGFSAVPGRDAGDRFQPLVLADVPPSAPLLREDLFAPVVSLVPVGDLDEALEHAALCPYALGASVFGPEAAARAAADRVRAGVVLVNDVIVPTADPRLPFGGLGESGFGVTRGAEGLLEMTAVQAVAVRRGRFLPHLDEPQPGPGDSELFRGYLAAVHGAGIAPRLRGLLRLLRAAARRPLSSRRKGNSHG